MISGTCIEPEDFVARLRPLLSRHDLRGLVKLLHSRWTSDQITSLLGCTNCDARKVAAVALSLVGGKCCIPHLAAQLKDPDPTINQMAEHALWSIWFRCGSPDANIELCRGSKALDQRQIKQAMFHFNRAIRMDAGFAEAYNQRAIAHYLIEDFDASIDDCLRAVDRMPCHFGAWAGMGHCHAQLGQFDDAIRCYRRALKINPHLEGIAQILEELPGYEDDSQRQGAE